MPESLAKGVFRNRTSLRSITETCERTPAYSSTPFTVRRAGSPDPEWVVPKEHATPCADQAKHEAQNEAQNRPARKAALITS